MFQKPGGDARHQISIAIAHFVSGQVAQRLDYDAWGLVTQDTNPGFQPFGFAGGLYDTQTGLVRFGARDYDPAVGRWTTKDSILAPDSELNLYGYALNDPIFFTEFGKSAAFVIDYPLVADHGLPVRWASHGLAGSGGNWLALV